MLILKRGINSDVRLIDNDSGDSLGFIRVCGWERFDTDTGQWNTVNGPPEAGLRVKLGFACPPRLGIVRDDAGPRREQTGESNADS